MTEDNRLGESRERLEASRRPAIEDPVERPFARLERHRSDVERLVREHRARNPRVFGSVARGEDQPGSDIDLLVSFDADASLLDLVELEQDLQELLGVPVDVISEGGLAARHREIRDQARPL